MKISVITAAYNSEETIEDTIRSVLSQTHQNMEYIVIDGGSKDRTTDIINQYESQIDHFVSEPDDGIYDALNKGISLATGDVVGFMHSDDLYNNKGVVEKVAHVFNENDVDGVYGDLLYVDKFNSEQIIRYWRSSPFRKNSLKKGWMPPHPTLYLRRAVYDDIGMFNTDFKIAADYDFVLRVLSQGDVRVEYLPEIMVNMRVGGESNRSLNNLIRKSREDYKALKKNSVGGFFTLAMKNFSKLPQFLWRG